MTSGEKDVIPTIENNNAKDIPMKEFNRPSTEIVENTDVDMHDNDQDMPIEIQETNNTQLNETTTTPPTQSPTLRIEDQSTYQTEDSTMEQPTRQYKFVNANDESIGRRVQLQQIQNSKSGA